MPPPKRESLPGRGSTPKNDGRAANGDRSKFRTDSAISNNRFGNERVLQPWVPDASDAVDGSLEKSSSSGGWDQFAENERLFGLKTDYDENMYTTVINKSHPQYRERKAIAEKKAQEIERSLAATAHVAEERVMDYVPNSQRGDEKENEEDKYSGVRRQDFPPLSDGRGNKYTPPAKRAPAAQSSVKGAPVDPAIISSQIKAPAKKPSTPPSTDDKAKDGNPEAKATVGKAAASEAQKEPVAAIDKQGSDATTAVKPTDNGNTPKASASPKRNLSPNKRDPATPGNPAPSATSTVEADVLKEFKHFASQQRINAEKVRSSKARQDKETKLADLKKFASAFKLTTPVPNDLVSIIAKDPAKQKEIQEKAIKNAEEMAKKAETAKDTGSPPKESQSKPAEQKPTGSSDSRTARAPTAPQNAGGQNGSRHQGARQQYSQQQMYHGQQPYRNNRGGPQHPSMQHQQPGNLAQRLRHVEHQRYSQAPVAQPHASAPDVRVPPTGPANNTDPNFNRRASAVPVHMSAAKALNPNTQEFQPRASAAPFNPSGISASSSPRSAVNNPSDLSVAAPQSPLIRRKTKSIDPKKCNILAHVKTFKPPQGRNWDDNAGLRPSYDTLPTWRQLQDDEKAESTMHLTYKEHFERQPFSAPSMNTPNPQHAMPQIPHQHQLPFHLQQGAHNMGMRQSPHMGHMQVQNNQHGPGQHPPFGNDDHHRMIPSSSSQSFASPRISQAPMAYNGMGSPAHVPYNQPVFMPPGAPQMGYRSFSNNQQYMSPQQGHQPMMMQPQFMHAPQGMVGGPQMMYPGGPPQFMPPAGPHQAMPGANGYASPGRPQAPMMVHQGSQQGQAMYGMSPNVQYNQPAYGPGQGGGPSRDYHKDYQLQHGYQHGYQHDSTQKRSGNTNGYHKGHSHQVSGHPSGSKAVNITSPIATASATPQG